MATFISSLTGVAMIDARTQSGTVFLPSTQTSLNRILTLKDIYGAVANSTVLVRTSGTDVFEDGTTQRAFRTPYQSLVVYAGQPGYWFTLNGTTQTTSIVSSLTVSSIASTVQTASLFASELNVGRVSTVNTVDFFGLFGNYNNTVLAEISTGAGNQELLVFKGSSALDRVRVQTTGSFVVETGVSARLFNSNTTQTLSNTTPAFVININSNVGIQTSNPTAPLDVAGTIRAVNVSSQTAVVSSIVSLNFSSVQAAVSSLIVNGLQFGDGTGWVSMGPIQAVSLSTIQGNANTNTTILTSTLALNVSSISGVASPFVSQGRLTANQNIAANTNDVLVQFVSDFDPNGWLLNAGTSTARVLPTIAGYYSVTYTVWWATGTGTNQINIQIRKNGQSIAINQQAVNTTIGLTMTITKIAFMNGTSDYFDFSAFTGTGGATQTIQYGASGNSPGVYYSVNLIR
jgi:hypothetical protein